MLKKLIKNEYIATVRYMVPLYIILAILTIMNKVLVEIDNNSEFSKVLENSVVYKAIAGLLLISYVISIFAVLAFTVILIVKRFYDNMLKDEAYLSFTLPVTTKQHLISKVLVSYSWIVISGLAVFASICVMNIGTEFLSGVKEVLEGFKQLWQNGYGLEIAEGMGLFVIGIYLLIIIPYTCFSVGQRFNGHPLIGALITYIVIYTINQFIGIATVIVITAGNIELLNNMTELQVYHFVMGYELILMGVEAIVYTIVTHYMLDKKLNLE